MDVLFFERFILIKSHEIKPREKKKNNKKRKKEKEKENEKEKEKEKEPYKTKKEAWENQRTKGGLDLLLFLLLTILLLVNLPQDNNEINCFFTIITNVNRERGRG